MAAPPRATEGHRWVRLVKISFIGLCIASASFEIIDTSPLTGIFREYYKIERKPALNEPALIASGR
jgi:hypothetical protein